MPRLSLAQMYLKEMELYRKRGIGIRDMGSLEKYFAMRILLNGVPLTLPEIINHVKEMLDEDFNDPPRRVYERFYKFLRRLERRGFLIKTSIGHQYVFTLKPQILKELNELLEQREERGFLVPFVEIEELKNTVLKEVLENVNSEFGTEISAIKNEIQNLKRKTHAISKDVQCNKKLLPKIAEASNQNFSQIQTAINAINSKLNFIEARIEKLEYELGSALKDIAKFLTEDISITHLKMPEDEYPAIVRIKSGTYSWTPSSVREKKKPKIDLVTVPKDCHSDTDR